ncbi:MAG: EFR1 family ferrodoxin [Spirochaetales bacterium]|uniref:EFR1 family ferrodoxin n=1 Tax=Candidatus Thalassospirochaeta sargassi TaxID=3119039 RepID=A0AAJ1II76_9SPIO|nr:EFR1 family ferrodoxin [Spirochaetales bacterium]
MKALIIYFSGTGNTGMITGEIISRLRSKGWDAVSVSIEEMHKSSRDFNFNLRTMDLLGFGFPVYKFSYPSIMDQLFPFLENLKPSGKPFFVYSTYCRFTGTALSRFANTLEHTVTADDNRTHTPVALKTFKCPSNGIASLKAPDSTAYREIMYFEAGIGHKLDDFILEILKGWQSYHDTAGGSDAGVFTRIRSIDERYERLAGRIERARYPFLKVDEELCIGCGLCAKRCPDNNLFMEDRLDDEGSVEAKPVAVPRDAETCLHCLRCLHICPKQAISFGPLVHGPVRYTAKVRKRLFAEAASKPAGSPENGSKLRNICWAAGILLGNLFSRR